MRSHIKLLNTLSVNSLPQNQRSNATQFPLQLAQAEYTTFENANVLVQSISHYLVHLEFYEYQINTHSSIDLEITCDSFFMIAMQKGCSVLYNNTNEVLSEVLIDSCKLTYLKAGKYKHSMVGGNHQILLLNIRPEWLIKKYGALKELHELISSYKDSALQTFSLPSFSIGPQLFNLLFKLNLGNEGRDIDIEMHVFVIDCINRYLVKLHVQTTYSESQEHKTREIGEFITENFASKIVGDEAALASHFMVSTTMLIRLAKLYFGKPLHQQVIELRMLNALKLLITTEKTVKEISMAVGYEDPKYFGRAFKKRFEITPNALRVCVV